MQIKLSTRANIALEQLPPNDHKLTLRFFDELSHSKRLADLRGKTYKLRSNADQSLFVAKVSQRYRAILECKPELITILEIIDHDRLTRTYGLTNPEP